MPTGTAQELTRVVGNMIFKPVKRQRQSPSLRRQEIVDAKILVLQKVIADIRRKARETPAWAAAYHSAVTSIEIEILELRK